MGRLQENTCLTRLQALFQGTEAACTVGIEQIAGLLPYGFHSLTDLPVGIRRTGNLGCDSRMRVTIQIEYTGKVTRIGTLSTFFFVAQ